MSLHTILPWFLLGMLSSVLTMVFGVSRNDYTLTMLAAAGFSLLVAIVAYKVNAPYWRARADGEEVAAPATAARRNARLMTTAYNWGGFALLAIYTLTQLRWQHGWQYAAGMLLLGGISFIFALMLGAKSEQLRQRALAFASILAAVQGIAATTGLVFLVSTGKLLSTRSDWAANYVFLFGGISIALLSAFALHSNKILRGAGD